MTSTNSGDMAATAVVDETELGPVVAAVGHTALHLLASLPVRPERLRVHAGGISVDLDWRFLPVPATALPPTGMPPMQMGLPVEAGASPLVSVLAPAGSAAPPIEPEAPNLHYICAPTVGTFYAAAEPGEKPFISTGSLVNLGQQIGIVEAMKLMVPVEADRGGKVVELLVANGESVEYGARLVALGPADAN
jgi:acetyl-CoA carboxylase biotin carboxyl carrier protein